MPVIDPDYQNTYWSIESTDNTVRICLHQRFDINYYTGLEKLENDEWIHVTGSSRGHMQSKSKAMQRVQHILETYTTFS